MASIMAFNSKSIDSYETNDLYYDVEDVQKLNNLIFKKVENYIHITGY